MKSWVLGFTNRILEAAEGQLPFDDRRRVALANFGASHPYPRGAREKAKEKCLTALEKLMPLDATKENLAATHADAYEQLMWEQTATRRSADYYEWLGASQCATCFAVSLSRRCFGLINNNIWWGSTKPS